jgi:flagellar assembly protein FliH
MTSSSDARTPRAGFPNVPAPEGSRSASSYTRFIPREELGAVQTWQPGSFGAGRNQASKPEGEAAGPTAEQWQARIEAAKRQGYEDGYRDGLVALEGFKKSHSAQVSAQVGQLVQSFDTEWVRLESDMAESLARSAVLLARQVLRSELVTRPEVVSDVAREAVNAVLMSARQIVVRVHPDDLPLVAQGAEDALKARGARLEPDASVQRGGCQVVSDAGSIDATVQARWERAAQAMGQALAWNADEPSPGGTP